MTTRDRFTVDTNTHPHSFTAGANFNLSAWGHVLEHCEYRWSSTHTKMTHGHTLKECVQWGGQLVPKQSCSQTQICSRLWSQLPLTEQPGRQGRTRSENAELYWEGEKGQKTEGNKIGRHWRQKPGEPLQVACCVSLFLGHYGPLVTVCGSSFWQRLKSLLKEYLKDSSENLPGKVSLHVTQWRWAWGG